MREGGGKRGKGGGREGGKERERGTSGCKNRDGLGQPPKVRVEEGREGETTEGNGRNRWKMERNGAREGARGGGSKGGREGGREGESISKKRSTEAAFSHSFGRHLFLLIHYCLSLFYSPSQYFFPFCEGAEAALLAGCLGGLVGLFGILLGNIGLGVVDDAQGALACRHGRQRRRALPSPAVAEGGGRGGGRGGRGKMWWW